MIPLDRGEGDTPKQHNSTDNLCGSLQRVG